MLIVHGFPSDLAALKVSYVDKVHVVGVCECMYVHAYVGGEELLQCIIN